MSFKQFQHMSFPKLNDYISNESETHYKKVSVFHAVHNSLLRSMISPSKNSPKILQYEQKLTKQNFSQSDIVKLMKHLFGKQECSITDRNLIRRLLLNSFPEELICAGGRQFVRYIKFQTLLKSQVIFPQDRKFYLLYKGKVTICAKHILRSFIAGEFFGQMELMGQEDITQIKAKSDCILLILQQEFFNQFFLQYFQDRYEGIRKKVALFDPILSVCHKYLQYMFLEKLYPIDYSTGDRIHKRGDLIQQIVLINEAEISHSQDRILQHFKVVGLTQVITNRKQAKQTIYCMENKTGYAIKLQDFNSFVDREKLERVGNVFADSDIILLQQKSQQQEPLNRQNYLRIKNVKFQNKKRRILTETNVSSHSPLSEIGSQICVRLQSRNNKNKSSTSTIQNPEFETSFVFLKEQFKRHQKHMLKSMNFRVKNFSSNRSVAHNKKWMDELTDCQSPEQVSYQEVKDSQSRLSVQKNKKAVRYQ